jgi:D-alanyl-D-alanine carboxypeptidase
MTPFYKNASLILLALFIMPLCMVAQNKVPDALNTYLNQAHQAGLFNGNILVVNGQKVVLKKAIGYADASKNVMLTAQHRFHIGSIAKEFDAVSLMMLQEQGKLSLDDKLAHFFPDLPAWAQKISVKNLLQYTSGLPEIKWPLVHSDADNWKLLQALPQLDFEPGSSYAYTNNNTFLRRRIVEKVSGMPFNQFVQQKLLKTARIKQGVVDPTDADPLVARSFNNDFKQDGLQVPISGWTCLNLDDFYRWSECINKFCLINPASTQTIITPFSPGKQAGLGRGTLDGDKVITHVHDGITLRYQALLWAEPTKGRTIIILTNQRQNNVYAIAEAVNAILDQHPYQPLAATTSK